MKFVFSTLLASLILTTSAFAVTPIDGLPAEVATAHKALSVNDTCQLDITSAPEAYDLGKGQKLFIVPCIMGAYQGFSRAYAFNDKDKAVTPLAVLSYVEKGKIVYGDLNLGEANFDPKTNTLKTFAKDAGSGDCGQSSVSKILVSDYVVVAKTIEIRNKSNCDGKYNTWPVVFKQR